MESPARLGGRGNRIGGTVPATRAELNLAREGVIGTDEQSRTGADAGMAKDLAAERGLGRALLSRFRECDDVPRSEPRGAPGENAGAGGATQAETVPHPLDRGAIWNRFPGISR